MSHPTLVQLARTGAVSALAAALLGTAGLAAQDRGGGDYAVSEYARVEDPGESIVVRRINAREEVAAGLPARSNGRGVGPRALILTAAGALDVPLGRPSDFSASYDLNDEGEIAGAFNGDTALRPFRSMRRSAFVALPLLPGHSGGVAFGINRQGESVGYTSGPDGPRAVWWTRRGEIQPLPGLPETSDSRALGVNDRGDVVGAAGEQPQRAVLWPRKGQVVELGTLSGFAASEAGGTNNRGDIVGNATGVDGAPDRSRAVLWDASRGGPQDLGTLPGDTDSRANGVNARGDVVGSSTGPAGDRAFLWTSRDGMVDLNARVSLPGVVLVEALGINDAGAIVAVGQEAHGHAPGGEADHGDHELPRRVLVLKPRR